MTPDADQACRATLSSLGELEGDDQSAGSPASQSGGGEQAKTIFEQIQASRHMMDVTSALLKGENQSACGPPIAVDAASLQQTSKAPSTSVIPETLLLCTR